MSLETRTLGPQGLEVSAPGKVAGLRYNLSTMASIDR